MANELQPGRHKVTLRDSKIDQIGQKGTPAIRVFGSLDSSGEDVEARIWLTEGAASMARQQLRALGFDPDTEDVAQLDETGRLNGLSVEFTLRYGEYRGKVQQEWNVAGARQDTSSLNAMLRGAGSPASKARAASAPAAPPRAAPTPTSSGIPRMPKEAPFVAPPKQEPRRFPPPPPDPDDSIPF
jgi:hypothetical protein